MEITRTANAGVLLKLDGMSVLLDGVSKEVFPYLKTPTYLLKELTDNYPDIIAFTHEHDDHYDEAYVKEVNMLRPVFGSEHKCFERVEDIKIQSVLTRHIGKTDIKHVSFVIEGSKCVWFMGDASPSELKKMTTLKIPDVLIVPFAYAMSEASWKNTKAVGAKCILIVHLPDRENDPYKLWSAVEATTKNDFSVRILEMGEKMTIL